MAFRDSELIVTTQLAQPLAPAHLVARARVGALLGRHALRPVTLVCAPAGFGKTTCIVEWLDGRGANAAWYTLSAAHDDARTFLAHLVAALERRIPGAFADLLARVLGREAGADERDVARLVNLIDALPEPLIVVVDDLHLAVSDAVHGLLGYLIEHAPRAACR